MLIVLRGLLTGISGGQTFFELPGVDALPGHRAAGSGMPAVDLDLPGRCSPSAIVVLGCTGFGRSLYAIGGNVDAAKAAGIRTDRVLWIVLVIGSVLAALAGLLLSGRWLGRRRPGQRLHLHRSSPRPSSAAISLNGGKGTMFGAFTGILLLFMIQNVLTLGGVPPQWIDALNGAIILVALIISRITGAGAGVIVDAHVHLWDPEVLDYPWLPDALRFAHTAFEGRAVVVEADARGDELGWLESLDGVEAIVAHAPLEGPCDLAALAERPRVRGRAAAAAGGAGLRVRRGARQRPRARRARPPVRRLHHRGPDGQADRACRSV